MVRSGDNQEDEGVEVAKHECHCKGCGKRIDQGERVKTMTVPQICGEGITYTYHPSCYARLMRYVYEVYEFYKWKEKNQKKLDRKYKVKEAIRRIREVIR